MTVSIFKNVLLAAKATLQQRAVRGLVDCKAPVYDLKICHNEEKSLHTAPKRPVRH
jgi:hypothetical protein